MADSRRLRLAAADGAEVVGRLATTRSDGGAPPGLVLIPDVRGLQPYYEALAEEFAEAGVHALAIDQYCRSAGAAYRDEHFDHAAYRGTASDAHVRADVQAACAELRAVGAPDLYVLGFCFGGRAAFMQASESGITGVVGFYGWPLREEPGGSSPVAEARAGRVHARVLALYGGADRGIPPEHVAAYDEALTAAGAEHHTVVYPGAPHAFFDRAMADHAEACADAWRRVLDFLRVPAG